MNLTSFNKSILKSPCIDCSDRHESCHSTCVRYTTWKDDLEQKKKDLHNQQFVDRSFDQLDRIKKYRNKVIKEHNNKK